MNRYIKKPVSGAGDQKALKIIGNVLLGLSLAIVIYLLADMYIFNRAPAGTCPLTSNRPWIYLAIGLCALSLILSFFERKEKK
ncbi:MAG: hypothetical protein SCM11_00265 [Bacillota bacterium]|nr:hypothetical protein [Bacillota bacterium]